MQTTSGALGAGSGRVTKPFLGLLAGTIAFAVFAALVAALLVTATNELGTSAIWGDLGLVVDVALMALLYLGCLYAGLLAGRFARHSSAADAVVAFAALAAALICAGGAAMAVVAAPSLGDGGFLESGDLVRLGSATAVSGLIAMVVGALLSARRAPEPDEPATFIYFDDAELLPSIDLREDVDLREPSPSEVDLTADTILPSNQ